MARFLALFLGGVASTAGRIVVVEARAQGEPASDTRTAFQLADALDAMPPPEVLALSAERLPPVPGATREQPIIQADYMVQQGRDAYLEGRFEEAVGALLHARDVLKRAIESFDEEQQATET